MTTIEFILSENMQGLLKAAQAHVVAEHLGCAMADHHLALHTVGRQVNCSMLRINLLALELSAEIFRLAHSTPSEAIPEEALALVRPILQSSDRESLLKWQSLLDKKADTLILLGAIKPQTDSPHNI